MTLMQSFDHALCENAKWAFTTRRVTRKDVAALTSDFDRARAGDLVLCQVLAVGQHKKLQLAERWSSTTYPGDLVVVCLGDRYAPDQFMAKAAVTDGLLQLAAGGGVAGTIEAAHANMEEPTTLLPIGLLVNEAGQVINVSQYALPPLPANKDVTVLGVFGASMNSGKTTAAASLAHGLKRAGYRVAGIKATGTGAFGDYNAFADAGVPVADFTDAGMATTYRMPLDKVEQGFDTLIATAARNGAQIVVVEIADGVFQQETRAILGHARMRNRLDGVLFAAPDALSAVGGVTVLASHGITPFAISGMLTLSPLAVAEASEATGIPVLAREDLWDCRTIAPHVKPLLRRSKDLAAA